MAIDRPTFDESWHRVAELRPRLRSIVQVHRQHYRGQRWHVLRDPGNNQSFRLDEAAWGFVSLLDGRRTVAQAWKIANSNLGDRSPTQGESIRLLGQLYTSNLLHADLSTDAVGMFERLKRRRNREVGGYVMNLMFARFPIFDPDPAIEKLTPIFGWIFGPVGFVLWAILMIVAAVNLAGQGTRLVDQAQGVLDPGNIAYLYLCFAGIKLIHEFGHGVACKRYGKFENDQGEVHTLGLMLLVLTPVPYVDASSAWVFRNKWRRMMVGAAGMYVELAVAAVAAMLWAHTSEGHLIHALAYNVLFIASVSTVLFNANPLLRFDGYYILSDFMEMPNLNQRSKDFLYYLVRRYVYGVHNPQNPAHSLGEKITFVIFGIAAFIYRMFIGVAIVLFVASEYLLIGAIMAVTAAIGWAVVPVVKMIHYLLTSPELQRTRPRALAVSAVAAVTLLALVGFVPVRFAAYAPGVVEANDQTPVFTRVGGKLISAMPSGAAVQAGLDAVVELEDPELVNELRGLLAEKRELQVRYLESRDLKKSPAEAQAYAAQLTATQAKIDRVRRDLAALHIAAPTDGRWLTLDVQEKFGSILKRGEQVGLVATLDDMVVKVAADQWSGPRLIGETDRDRDVEIRVDGWPDATYHGRITKVSPAGREQLPSPALSMSAGGRVMPDAKARRGDESAEPVFEIEIDVKDLSDAPPLLPGQRVMVRFPMPDRPILTQAWLYGRQLLQRRWAW